MTSRFRNIRCKARSNVNLGLKKLFPKIFFFQRSVLNSDYFVFIAEEEENVGKMRMIGKAGRRSEVGVDDESDGNLRAHDDHHPKLFSEVYVKIAREDVVGQGPGRQLVPVPAPHGHILGPSPPLGHIVDQSRVRR